jgi:uncharacterized Ntn-hydrolase superfamily protein
MRTLTCCILLALSALPSAAQERNIFDNQIPGQETWFSTFSIIAFDPATNELGVAVQSRAFGAGGSVPWAEAGVGAVATQAASNRTYGPKAMALLKQGLTPEEVIKKITDDDPGRDTRQVAVIDAKGRMAAYTGKHVIDRNFDETDHVHFGGYAGSIAGKNYSVQGNTLASEQVLKAMAAGYENSKGTMAERLMDALDGGQSKGGDTRGMQAAGILVVKPITDANTTTDRTMDIRVDDSPNPFKELRRVLNVRLSGSHQQTATQLAKEGKLSEAIAEQKKAVEMNPASEQLHYVLAQRYAEAGEYLNALLSLQEAIGKQPRLKQDASEDPLFLKMTEMVEFRRLVGGSQKP